MLASQVPLKALSWAYKLLQPVSSCNPELNLSSGLNLAGQWSERVMSGQLAGFERTSRQSCNADCATMLVAVSSVCCWVASNPDLFSAARMAASATSHVHFGA